MKVGVHFGHVAPSAGGLFTFQRNVSLALSDLASQSGHEFVVGETPHVPFAPGRSVEVVRTRRGVVGRAWSRAHRQSAVIANAMLGRNRPAPDSPEADPFRRRHVDLMWYVGPFVLTMDIPFIYTLLDLQHVIQPYFPEVSGGGAWHARERHYGEALRRAARILVSTHVGKAEIERFYQVPADRIVVLPYAGPIPPPAPADGGRSVLDKYGLPPAYLFYPAQFWPQKNHVGLLRALCVLRDRWNIVYPLVLAGADKGNRAYVEQHVRELGLDAQVHMLGFVPAGDVNELYRHAFALTMPTLVGPDNIPALEAFALGCPVINSDLPGFAEQLGDAALLASPTDDDAFATAIKTLHDDPALRATLVRRGLDHVARWTWTDYVNGVLRTIDDFASIRRAWPGAARR